MNKLQDVELDDLYISHIRYLMTDETPARSYNYESKQIADTQERANLKALIASRFKGVEDVKITCVPSQVIGHLSLSKYGRDLESQKQMVTDLLELDGIKIHGEIEESDYDLASADKIREFDRADKDGNRYDGDFYMVHGNEPYAFDKTSEMTDYINGKPSHYHDTVGDEFWSSTYEECMKPYLDELDPKGIVSVYHRKGKDWYVAPTLKMTEIAISYFDEEYNDAGECEEDAYYALTYSQDNDLLVKFTEVLDSYREDMSVRSYIEDELDENNKYRDGVVNFNLVELLYEGSWDLREEILDSITEWKEESIKEEFRAAYQKAIDSKVRVAENLKVEFTYGKEISTYNHLRILKVLEKRFGYELIQSVVSANIGTVAWAIKRDGEEYHFDITSVIADDINEEISLREFLINALGALAKRKLERLSQAELYEKASHIFVGIEDSLLSGNCSFGTNQFIAKHHIDTRVVGGIRGDVLLQMENSNFTKRAIAHAISSHGGVAC
jgi:hypothetical protein